MPSWMHSVATPDPLRAVTWEFVAAGRHGYREQLLGWRVQGAGAKSPTEISVMKMRLKGHPTRR